MLQNNPEELEGSLTKILASLFDSVILNRTEYYQRHREPTPDDVDLIISNYATKNMVISGGASLAPGPWGLLVILPEITLVLDNQIKMIYDIGVAYGKGHMLDRNLLALVFAGSLGTGALAYLTIKGGRIVVRRASLRFFQQLVKMAAGKITQRMIKSALSKWVPIAGAAVMAGWSYYSTVEIGRKAREIMEKPFDPDDECAPACVVVT